MSKFKQNRTNKEFNWANDLLLTILNMVFEENQEQREKSNENSIDLHDDLTNKIDKIIGKSDNDSSQKQIIDNNDENISLKESNVESRLPLSKKISSHNVKPESKPGSIDKPKMVTNDGLESEITFREMRDSEKISSTNFEDELLQLRNQLENRIEIINFDSLNKGEVKKDTKKTLITIEKPKMSDKTKDKSKKLDINGIFLKKADAEDKSSKKTSFFDLKQTSKSDSKSKVYFLRNSKQEDVESKKSSSEKSPAPNKLDKELNELKEKELELKEQKKKLVEQEKEALKEAKERASLRARNEKKSKERQRQEEKLKKLELKKASLEKKEREKEARKAAKIKEFELKKKAKEEKLLKKIEMKKAVDFEREKEKTAKKAEKEQLIRQKLHDREKDLREKEAKKTEKFAFRKDKKDKNKIKLGDFFKREKKIKPVTRKILEEEVKTEIKPDAEESQPEIVDEDVKKLLTITDNLLGELPDEVIDKFAKSEDFELYSKVLHKYKIK